MAVELIPKREQKPIFGQLFFVFVAVAVLIGVVSALFILEQFIQNTAKELAVLDKTLQEDTRPLEQELEAELREYKRKIDIFKAVIEERRILLPVFVILENTTHPDVFFSSLAADPATGMFSLEGTAQNFPVLEQQRLIWNAQEDFESELGGMNLGAQGEAGFSVELRVNQEILDPL